MKTGRSSCRSSPQIEATDGLTWRAGQKPLLDAGRYAEAARLASDLIAIDEGASPVGPSILGRCRVGGGDLESARRLFETARDVCRALPLNTSPGCSTSIQVGLRQSGERHGFHVVDLPMLMRERLDGALPDRRMFLDYCHLTAAGIRLLTEAVAATALPLLGADGVVDLEGAVGELGPSPEVEADAHFMAAVHCARWGQSGELLSWHCAEALRLSPAITEKMKVYLDAFRRSSPPWLDRGFAALAGPRGSPTYRYFCEISPFVDEDLREKAVIDAIGSTLGVGKPVLSKDRGLEINLLSRDHFATDSLNSVKYGLRQKAFLEAYEPTSRFVIHLNDRLRCRCELTYRTPTAETAQTIAVWLNRVQVGAFPATMNWASVNFDNLALVSGRNELAIIWPPPKDVAQLRLRQSKAEIRRNVLPNPLVDFGQLYQLRLAIVSTDDATP